MEKLNDWVATQVTKGMATMWCAYFFLLWSILPIFWPQTQSVVFYVSGGIIQLVALSLIMVGQNVLGRAAEKRAQEDHDTIMAEFETQRQELEELRRLHEVASEELMALKNLSTDFHKFMRTSATHRSERLDKISAYIEKLT